MPIFITASLSIPDDEITLVFDRSSGPGGQNVNKVSTRVSLYFDVDGSSALTPEQKRRIHHRLSGSLSRESVLRVVSGKHRTQAGNRAAAVKRLAELLREALRPIRPRIGTMPTRSSVGRRLTEKKQRGMTKQIRRSCPGNDG